MKYLLVLAVVLAGVWLWRRRQADLPPSRPAPRPTAQAGLMVTCRHCGVHLPASEAIADAQGHYCSVEHLRLQRGRPGLRHD